MLIFEHVKNKCIRCLILGTKTIIDIIECSSLKWFESLLKMSEVRWPKRMFNWKGENMENLNVHGISGSE